jgi:hypothetical protein
MTGGCGRTIGAIVWKMRSAALIVRNIIDFEAFIIAKASQWNIFAIGAREASSVQHGLMNPKAQ